MAMPNMREPIETGCPDGFQYLHPTMQKNFGQWKYHEHPRPGVLRHVANSGEEIWTVRVGTQRILDVFSLRELCDIGDKYADGHVRFTIRSNLEYMVNDAAKVDPLIEAVEAAGYIVGGTQNSVTMISHTQGWLHCDIPGTDASGVVKSMMDELIDEFKNADMPNRVHITTSCCQINCGGQGDIAINVQHTKPPKINHSLVANVCERPSVVPSRHRERQAVTGGGREEVHLLWRLLPTVPAHADQRSYAQQAGHLGRRQPLQCPCQTQLPETGGCRDPQQSAALARGNGYRQAHSACVQKRCARLGADE
jgi:hypothetical protein